MENSLGRSLKFGRVAGSLIVLCRLGRLTEAEARAIVLAGEGRRRDAERCGIATWRPSLRSATATPSA
jgi:hypothetical protein